MLTERRSWLLAAPVDVLMLPLSFYLTFLFRLGWPPPPDNLSAFRTLLPFFLVSSFIVFFAVGLYHSFTHLGNLARALLIADVILFLVTLSLAFWLRGFALPRSVTVLAFALHIVLMAVWRSLLWGAQHRRRKNLRVVVAAPPDEAAEIVRKLWRESRGGYDVLCAATPDVILDVEAFTVGRVDLLVVGSSVNREDREQLIRLALRAHTTIQVLPDLSDILLVGSLRSRVDDLAVLEMRPLALPPVLATLKRTLDLIIAIPAILIASPIMLGVAIAIKATSPGPALLAQQRVGLGGHEFKLYKFRTMVTDAELQTGPILASADDPRTTPIGRVLRHTRLDELPQLWNVIVGNMSLVGPRPERPHFVSQHSQELADYPIRHVVPPGITGLAQIMGNYESKPIDKLRFDLSYIREYSLWLDVQLLLLTLRAVLFKNGKGASRSDQTVNEEIDAILARSYNALLGAAEESHD